MHHLSVATCHHCNDDEASTSPSECEAFAGGIDSACYRLTVTGLRLFGSKNSQLITDNCELLIANYDNQNF
jgi:hypothetical protein